MKTLLLLPVMVMGLGGCVAYGVPYSEGYGPGYGYGYSEPAYVHPTVIYNGGYRHTPYRDRDGDGIANRRDRDRDGDGVRNRDDRRPNNPRRN